MELTVNDLRQRVTEVEGQMSSAKNEYLSLQNAVHSELGRVSKQKGDMARQIRKAEEDGLIETSASESTDGQVIPKIVPRRRRFG